jgi:hypothetical protein
MLFAAGISPRRAEVSHPLSLIESKDTKLNLSVSSTSFPHRTGFYRLNLYKLGSSTAASSVSPIVPVPLSSTQVSPSSSIVAVSSSSKAAASTAQPVPTSSVAPIVAASSSTPLSSSAAASPSASSIAGAKWTDLGCQFPFPFPDLFSLVVSTSFLIPLLSYLLYDTSSRAGVLDNSKRLLTGSFTSSSLMTFVFPSCALLRISSFTPCLGQS